MQVPSSQTAAGPARQNRLAAGDIAPRLVLPDQDGQSVDLADDTWAGRPTVLLLLADPASDSAAAGLKRLQGALAALQGAGAQVLALTTGLADQVKSLASALELGFPLLADPTGQAFESCGLVARDGVLDPTLAVCLVLRGNGHVMAVLEGATDQAFEAALALLRAEAELRATRTMTHHPPILIVPDVLSREDCQRLIGTFLMDGNVWVEPGHGDKA